MTKEGSGVLPLTFLGEIQNMRKSLALRADLCWDLGRVEEGEERQQVSSGTLTCILAWKPGLPDGQAKGEQQFTAGSGQAQEASLWNETGLSWNCGALGGVFLEHAYSGHSPSLICSWKSSTF